MNSPSKRRKTNKDAKSTPNVRKLDFFFGPKSTSDQQATSDGVHEQESELTDEQLARKLQEQWDREDTAAQPAGSAASNDEREVANQSVVEPWPDAVSAQEPEKAKRPPAITEGPFETVSQRKNILSLQSAAAAEDTVTVDLPLDQSPLTFDPADYLPSLKQQWSLEGGVASYALLTRCFTLVNLTQSRIKIVDTLVNMLRIIIEADPDSLLSAVWLTTNSIAPPYVDIELGLGGSVISKALKKVCGLDGPGLKQLYDKHGDAGDVAFEAKKRQSRTLVKPKPLTIKSVYESLHKIANSKGHGSQEMKQRITEKLIQDARGAEESRYIVRTLVQHLRIGAVKTTMLIALSRAFLLSRPANADYLTRDRAELGRLKKDQLAEVWQKSEEIVKACFARRPNYNDLVPALLEIGVCDELLIRCGLAMHIPLRPMLGNITRDLKDMLVKLESREFSCEYKYDGQRAQVHCDANGKVTIFSRHLEVMTEKYPDLVALVPKIRGDGVSSFILEGEVVAIDRDSGELKPFQTLTNRAKKDVDISSVKVNVCLFAFDLMYLNGEPLLDRCFRDRRGLLRGLFTEIPFHFTWVKSIDATSGEAEMVSDFFKSAIDIRCEGIMVKILDNAPLPGMQDLTVTEPPEEEKKKGGRRKALLSTYEPDKRVDSWLKVKKDYDSESFETLDLVPVAGWHGQGRKSKWWSPVLLAVRNPETGSLEAVTKCISGFTDTMYKQLREKYTEGSENLIARPSWVEYAGHPDVWWNPQEVWEVAFADITMSPVYTAALGLVSEERGLSTRFPRFLKVRTDKSIDECTTSDYLATLYRRQQAQAPRAEEGSKKPDGDDEERPEPVTSDIEPGDE